MKRIFPLIIILLFSCQKEELVDLSLKAELENVIESAFKQYQMPGLAYLAVKNDSVVISEGIGYANVMEKMPFTPQTRMIIASISKTIIATAIMQLVEKGSIDLDADINQYLPFSVRNPRYPKEPITTRMLLTHTSSISDGGYIYELYLYGFTDYPVSLLSFEKEYLSKNGQYYSQVNYSKFKPNSNYEYSNVAAALAACLVEQVSGVNFNDYCKVYVFQPLGMSKTTWFFSETPKSEIAIPYSDLNNMNPDKSFYSYPTYPDGHLITTTEDLSKFMRAYIMDGTFNGYQLLQQSSVDTILSIQFETESEKQGLIFYHLENSQFSVWGHNGGDPGVSTEMYFDKTKKVGYIMFTNRSDAYPKSLRNALLQFANQ
ncbi:MAG: serine hydrolase [Bacteroidales bacterium]|nr:serine hydrolase [Bacteroidales bacterium]MBN2820960.1 serine hydrolase [Bacteroidales bacterium]